MPKKPFASKKPYKPFVPESIGNTVSCHTLARMLNEIGSNNMNRKVVSHIGRYFKEVKDVSLAIDCPATRKYVGEMMLREIKHFNIDILCPPHIINVIKNVKYCYVKDLFINDVPLNYSRPENADCKPYYWDEEDDVLRDSTLSVAEIDFDE